MTKLVVSFHEAHMITIIINCVLTNTGTDTEVREADYGNEGAG